VSAPHDLGTRRHIGMEPVRKLYIGLRINGIKKKTKTKKRGCRDCNAGGLVDNHAIRRVGGVHMDLVQPERMRLNFKKVTGRCNGQPDAEIRVDK